MIKFEKSVFCALTLFVSAAGPVVADDDPGYLRYVCSGVRDAAEDFMIARQFKHGDRRSALDEARLVAATSAALGVHLDAMVRDAWKRPVHTTGPDKELEIARFRLKYHKRCLAKPGV